MKKRLKQLFAGALSCALALCLLPTAALAVEWYETDEVYEVKPFYMEYMVASAPASEIREMTIEGKSVEVSVYPAGTLIYPFWPLSFGDAYEYVDGAMRMTSRPIYLREDGVPAQGIYRIGVYSAYYGHSGDIWVTAEGSGTTEPEPEPEPEPKPEIVAGFTDVSTSDWYAGYVQTVVDKGLFYGKEEGIFAPEDRMSYAEFLTVLYKFSGDQLPASQGAWYQGYVDWAENAGLVPAEMAGFNPDAAITRQDMAALFGNFLNAYDHPGQPSAGEPSFADAGSIADYAADGVTLCYQMGLMSGKDGNLFDPLATATRAEVAVTMTNMATVMGW